MRDLVEGTSPGMQSDLIFTAQSAALRVWAGSLTAEEMAGPSTLDGWTVADLVGHLVAVHDAVAALRPVDSGPAENRRETVAGEAAGGETADGTAIEGPAIDDEAAGATTARELMAAEGDPHAEDAAPLTVNEYVQGYSGSAHRVAEMARTISRDTATDPLGAWDNAAAQAKRTLGALGAADRLVSTRRGPMMASAFLDTRVIELVVHAGDLRRSLPQRPAPPVLPSAQQRVLATLREVLTAREPQPEVLAAASALSPEQFVDLATGRTGPEPGLPAELAAVLPLL
jgi:hypothetical protein